MAYDTLITPTIYFIFITKCDSFFIISATIVITKCDRYLKFKVDRLQIILVAKNITVLQLFISRMPKMCAIPQLVSAPLNPIPTVEHFKRRHPQFEHSYGQHIYMN